MDIVKLNNKIQRPYLSSKMLRKVKISAIIKYIVSNYNIEKMDN